MIRTLILIQPFVAPPLIMIKKRAPKVRINVPLGRRLL